MDTPQQLNVIDYLVILAPLEIARKIEALARSISPEIKCTSVQTMDHLISASKDAGHQSMLISVGTGVIVPADILEKFAGRAINFHAASPDYPGRDPHHFAIYDGAQTYGATAHQMVAAVDAGDIIGVRYFDVAPSTTPGQLLQQANHCAWELMDDLLPKLLNGKPPAMPDVTWGTRKTSRRDFLNLCKVASYTDCKEFERRKAATSWEGRQNLYIDLHGNRFRLEGAIPKKETVAIENKWGEFTEDGYRHLLVLAKDKYRFAAFKEPGQGNHVIWRHDVDFSVHRALRLAEIESEEGVSATYFFMLSSEFYRLEEKEIMQRVERIRALGHRIGLHFEIGEAAQNSCSKDEMEKMIACDRDHLAGLIGAPLEAVSFHNPEATGLLAIDSPQLAGLVNTYGKQFRDNYEYCSDSNGYWRFEPLGSVLQNGTHERIQVLTHPVWWTPDPMPPRARVERCVKGRAAAYMRKYDGTLAREGRINVEL